MRAPDSYPRGIAGTIAPQSRSQYLVACTLSVLLLLVLTLRVDPLRSDHPEFARGDHVVYLAMAESPGDAHPPPFCYRILMPGLARVLPFDLAISFYVLTVLFLLASAVLMYGLLRQMGENHFYSLMGVVFFFSLNWGAKFLVFDFWVVDSALFFFITLAIFLFALDRIAGLVLALCLGVLAKEPALFLLPLFYGFRAHRFFDMRAVKHLVVVGALPVLVFVLLRLFVASSADYQPLALAREIGLPRLTNGMSGYLRGGTVGTWGVSLLALVFFAGAAYRSLALRSFGFLLLVYIQPFFATNVDRLLVIAFPIVIPLAVAGIRRLAERFVLSPWMVAGYVGVPYVLVVVKNGFQSPSPEKEVLYVAAWTIIVLLATRIGKRVRGARAV